MLMRPLLLLRALQASILALTVSACGSQSAPEAGVAPPPTPVVLATATIQDVPSLLTAVGHVEPVAAVDIRSRVDGEITEVAVRDGQTVTKGQLLFRIDARAFQIRLEQAEANHKRDQALLETAIAQEARYRDLMAQNYISKDGYAEVKSKLDIAAAAVRTDENEIANAKLQLDYARIEAPITGRVGKVNLARGNLVRASDPQSLIVINQMDPIYVSFALPEPQLGVVRAAQRQGELKVEAFDRESSESLGRGRLSFIDNTVNAATGTIQMRGEFRNERTTLWPGQFVAVQLNLGEETNVLTVPPIAVQTGPKGLFVFLAGVDGKAEVRAVTLARTTTEYAVIAAGLKAGDRVVVDGQSRLVPGGQFLERGAAGPVETSSSPEVSPP